MREVEICEDCKLITDIDDIYVDKGEVWACSCEPKPLPPKTLDIGEVRVIVQSDDGVMYNYLHPIAGSVHPFFSEQTLNKDGFTYRDIKLLLIFCPVSIYYRRI